MNKIKLSPNQANIIIFIAMAADIVIRPIYSEKKAFSAQSTVPAIVLLCFLTLVLFSPLWACNVQNIFQKDKPHGKIFSGMFCLLFIFAQANTLMRTEQFYRFISEESTPNLLFIFLVLMLSAYACKAGFDATGRAAPIVLCLMIVSFAIIFIFNANGMRLENLVYKQTPILNIKNNFLQSIGFAPEILLFFVIFNGSYSGKQNNFTVIITSISVVYILFAVFSELVFANSAVLLSQPAQTLARLGGISVFKRLDAVHIAIWILSALIKLWAFINAYFALSAVFTDKENMRIAIGVVFVAAITLTLYNIPQEIISAVSSVFTATLAVATIAFSLCNRSVYEEKV
ncbi:MAG: GerAB/ArcD/ProY family transporter [Oscillospiraceae bacterium]